MMCFTCQTEMIVPAAVQDFPHTLRQKKSTIPVSLPKLLYSLGFDKNLDDLDLGSRNEDNQHQSLAQLRTVFPSVSLTAGCGSQ